MDWFHFAHACRGLRGAAMYLLTKRVWVWTERYKEETVNECAFLIKVWPTRATHARSSVDYSIFHMQGN
jgi:hypothetical protein